MTTYVQFRIHCYCSFACEKLNQHRT